MTIIKPNNMDMTIPNKKSNKEVIK